MEENYNGSTEILKKIDDLLSRKTITPSSAMRILLEAQQHAIKENHDLKKRVRDLEAHRDNHWTHKITPRLAAVTFFIAYSFAISDIRKPVMAWAAGLISSVIKLF
jgi:hypothetical protein